VFRRGKLIIIKRVAHIDRAGDVEVLVRKTGGTTRDASARGCAHERRNKWLMGCGESRSSKAQSKLSKQARRQIRRKRKDNKQQARSGGGGGGGGPNNIANYNNII